MELAEETKARSAAGAAAKLAELPGPEIATELTRLNPAFALNVLAELPIEARERAMNEVAPDVAAQWQRNQITFGGTVGMDLDPKAADIDGDGDIDLVAPARCGLHWLENLRINTPRQ